MGNGGHVPAIGAVGKVSVVGISDRLSDWLIGGPNGFDCVENLARSG
jgi:hypothetical protein